MRFDFPWAGEMNRLQNEMERLFGPGLSRSGTWSRGYPPINVWEDDSNLYVETEVPGMQLDDFEVFASNDNQLTLQGERKRPDALQGNRHRQERSFGRFSRIIDLPVPIQGEATFADYRAGVLRITLPKREEAKPRRIAVKAR